MLCTKIIFSKEFSDVSKSLSDFMSRNKMHHKVYEEDSSEIEADTDDEGLFAICCELARQITEKCVKPAVHRFLQRMYACFNSDESRIICSNVLNRDFLSELPGRLYIYVKVNKCVNPTAFYVFMCKDIAKEIKTSTEEEAEKILAMNDNCDFIELLRCFADVSMDSVEAVELVADSRGLHITGCYPENGSFMEEYSLDEADVLAELVTMNPKKIHVSGKEEFLKNDISAVITAVFDGRIQYK